MLRHIPNFLTCCNLLCGAFGTIFLLEHFNWSSSDLFTLSNGFHPVYFVWAACIFDFFDGFAARLLKVSSPIGKELDSLADVISFGLFPSVYFYKWIQTGAEAGSWLPYIALSVVVFSALRLAKFNIDETQRDSFKGLPTPANALFLTSLPFLHFNGISIGPVALVLTSIIFSLLLVSRIDLFALKFKDFSWQSNKIRFTFLALAVLLFATLKLTAIPLVIILYILLSLGMAVVPGNKK